MGAKPMMLTSRGKKSLVALPSAREILAAADEDDVDRQLGGGGRGSPADELADDSSSYWIVADERLPVVAVRLNERWKKEERKKKEETGKSEKEMEKEKRKWMRWP